MDRTETFAFAGHEIRATIKELPQSIELDVESALSQAGPGTRGNVGLAKYRVLQEGLGALYVDGKQQVINHRDASGATEFRLPRLRDPETRKSLLDKLLHVIVAGEDWLGFVEPFSDIFAAYLPEEDLKENGEPKENPTETGAS